MIGYLKAALDREKELVFTSVRYCESSAMQKTVEELVAQENTYYCFSVLQHNYLDCLAYTKAVKDLCPESLCIWGNIQAAFHAEYILKKYSEVDYICAGEGELTLVELIRMLTKGLELSSCKGIYYRDGESIIYTGFRELISDLDALPFPDRSFIPVKYRNPISMLQIPVFASRGCMGTCTFCDARVINVDAQGKSCVRTRSIKNVISELHAVKQEFKNSCIYFMDSTFCPDSQNAYIRLEELYEELKASGLDIHFFMNLRAEQFDDRLMKSLKRLRTVGLKYLFVGFESGNSDDLKLYGKRATIIDNIKAVDYLYENGFLDKNNSFGFDFGFINFNPYSSIQSLHENLSFLSKEGLPTTIFHLISVLQITSSTPITRKLQMDGLLSGCTDGPICEPYAYVFKNPEVLHILQILREVAQKIEFKDFYRSIDRYSLYFGLSTEYDEIYQQYKTSLSAYMDMNKRVTLEIYHAILEQNETGGDVQKSLEQQSTILSQYNIEKGKVINRMLRRMNYYIMRWNR